MAHRIGCAASELHLPPHRHMSFATPKSLQIRMDRRCIHVNLGAAAYEMGLLQLHCAPAMCDMVMNFL